MCQVSFPYSLHWFVHPGNIWQVVHIHRFPYDVIFSSFRYFTPYRARYFPQLAVLNNSVWVPLSLFHTGLVTEYWPMPCNIQMRKYLNCSIAPAFFCVVLTVLPGQLILWAQKESWCMPVSFRPSCCSCTFLIYSNPYLKRNAYSLSLFQIILGRKCIRQILGYPSLTVGFHILFK